MSDSAPAVLPNDLREAETDYDAHLRQGSKLSAEAIQELLDKNAPDAVRVLVRLMKTRKVPPSVRRQCAVDILNQRFGRPEQRAQPVERGRLVINVVRLSSGQTQSIDLGPSVALDVDEALRLAETIEKEGSPCS